MLLVTTVSNSTCDCEHVVIPEMTLQDKAKRQSKVKDKTPPQTSFESTARETRNHHAVIYFK